MKRVCFAAMILMLAFFSACSAEAAQNAADGYETAAETSPQNEAAPLVLSENFTAITGWDMMAKMGIGINIGNTLDANGAAGERQGLESETMWGAPRIEQWQLEAIALKGLESVRIPVTWGNHMCQDTFEIDEEWMDRVQEVVDWALEAGLIVVINTHHEHFLYDQMVDGGNFDLASHWLTAVWTQIAERFKYYPETLIFEPMNEPSPGGTHGPMWYWDRVGHAEGRRVLSALTNRLNRHALAVIRNSGGYNSHRIVVNTITQADSSLLYQYEHTFDDPFTMVGVFFYTDNEEGMWLQFNNIRDAVEQGIPVMLKETLPIGIEDREEAEAWASTWYPKLAALPGPPVPMWWNTYGSPPGEFFCRFWGRWVYPMVDIVFAAYGKTPGPSLEVPAEFLEQIFDDSGWCYDDDVYWFGGIRLRDALLENRYFAVYLHTDELLFQIHSGRDGYTNIVVPGRRIEGTNWWYVETEEPMSHHQGSLEELGWWFQIKLHGVLITDSGIPRAIVGNTLPAA